MRRSMRIVMVMAVGFVVSGYTPGAWACSCAPMTDAQHFEASEVVFIGTAIDRSPPKEYPEGEPVPSSEDVDWTFDVESAQKGTISDPQIVVGGTGGATCGYIFTEGERYQVWGSKSGDKITTSTCSGTRWLDQDAAYRENDPAPGARILTAGTTSTEVVGTNDTSGTGSLPRSGVPTRATLVLGTLALATAGVTSRRLRAVR